MGRLRVAALCALLIVTIVATGCTDPSGTTIPPSETSTDGGKPRVTTTDTHLRLDGQPWWPTGFNAYQLGTDWSVNRGCGAAVDVDDYFDRLPPRALTRISLFSMFAVDKHSGLLNFGPLDAVFAAAKRHRQMVLPVLTGGPGTCEDDRFKERTWYESGWKTKKSVGGLTFADWMRAAITRWRNEPSLVGWEMVGEPEASMCTARGCDWQVRTCPTGGADVLRRFYDDAGARLRSLDDRHLVFAGFIGGDQCGMEGDDYAKVGASPTLDVLDFHDYGTTPTDFGPAGSDLPTRLDQARALRKPLIVGEMGIKAGACLSLPDRADQFRRKITVQRDAGTAAALLWAFVPDPRPDDCTFDIGYDGPAWQVVTDLVR
ncbi:beta-mannosidase [Gordonia sp. ABSL11-1]|uniref:beta-mannosidase n=1 Tax=Gordonia sp. ABSL11-1 TaxID=3053924 RepID=UPI002572A3F3|nr:beta-mannosidase [Gordonia sp. ABSL11-1]MDL9945194.1 beta-mannosidase [Gordonia sp. ABSL11-1]